MKLWIILIFGLLSGCATSGTTPSLDQFNSQPSVVETNQAKLQAATVF